jgi:hypothetical protein
MKHTTPSLKNAIWSIKNKAPASCVGIGNWDECSRVDMANCDQVCECEFQYCKRLADAMPMRI